MEPVRKFKIIVNSKECGTCSGPTPSAVAKKVVKKLCGTSSKVVKFRLKECKRGCERECGPYQGRMEKLDKPYTRAGKKITHRVVCGKVRKMRGGRDLTIEDFEKRDGDGDFRLEIFQNEYPYIYFGEIASSNNNSKKRYEFVTSIDSIFNEFHIEEIKDGKVEIIKLSKNTDEIYTRKDVIAKLKKLFEYLSKLNEEDKKKILNNNLKSNEEYLKLDSKNKIETHNNIYPFFNQNFMILLQYIWNMITVSLSVVTEKNKLKINNNEVPVSEPNTLFSGCTKYPANYKFSGKNSNGKPYNTNKLFRGCKLYSYDPKTKKYIILLDELDYLVNVYDDTGNPSSIVYSGLLGKKLISTRTKDGDIKINYIKYYLYCNSSNNSTNINFPCWIIVKK